MEIIYWPKIVAADFSFAQEIDSVRQAIYDLLLLLTERHVSCNKLITQIDGRLAALPECELRSLSGKGVLFTSQHSRSDRHPNSNEHLITSRLKST